MSNRHFLMNYFLCRKIKLLLFSKVFIQNILNHYSYEIQFKINRLFECEGIILKLQSKNSELTLSSNCW